MPRHARLIYADTPLHITCRGNNRQDIFNREEDKLYYHSLLKNLKIDNRVDIFHYCIMTNHVHLILYLSRQSNLPRFMKQLNLSYFVYYKKIYGYCGHLWQGRFKSNLIDTDSYLLQCGKYIELNPVRAGIVTGPEAYRFSSYRYYAYGEFDPLITPNPAYLGLANDDEGLRKQYVAFVVDSSIINTQSLQAQLFIGSDTFIRKLEEYYRIRNTSLQRGRPKKAEK